MIREKNVPNDGGEMSARRLHVKLGPTHAVKLFLQILIGITQLVSSRSNTTQCFRVNSSSLLKERVLS
jgi:hypothetical protein